MTKVCLQQFASGETKDCDTSSVCLNCADLPGWSDRHGRSCSEVCPSDSKVFTKADLEEFREDEANGVPAYEACCACGGGTKSPSAWAYMGRAEALFGDKVHMWPQPRTASHYVPGPDCDLSTYGLTLDSVTGEISGIVESAENQTEAVTVSCNVMAVQSTDEGLFFNASMSIRVSPFSFGSSVVFLEEGDAGTAEVHTKLPYEKGSMTVTCTPTLPWLDSAAIKEGKLAVKEKGPAVGGVGGGIDGTEAAEAAVGELVDEEGMAGAAAGMPLEAMQSGTCTVTYTRIAKKLPDGTAETATDSLSILVIRYQKWKSIDYPDLPVPNTLKLVAGQTLPPTAKELLPENGDYDKNRGTFFRASKPAYFTIACGVPGAEAGQEGSTEHNLSSGDVKFSTADGDASVRLLNLNAHSGLIGGYTGYVQGNFNALNPKWDKNARRYVVALECRVFGRDMADALTELKGGATSKAPNSEWIVSPSLKVEISDAYCWQDTYIERSFLAELTRYNVKDEAEDGDAKQALCLRRCVDDPTCAITGLLGKNQCVTYRVDSDVGSRPTEPCNPILMPCIQVWTKMKDCTSENTCRKLEIAGSASLSGVYCPIVDDLKTGRLVGLPLSAAAGMTGQDTIYMEPNTPERDPEKLCGDASWLLRQANPGADFVDKATSDFQLSGRLLACVPASEEKGEVITILASEYIDLVKEKETVETTPEPSLLSDQAHAEEMEGLASSSNSSVVAPPKYYKKREIGDLEVVDVKDKSWGFKFVPRLCPSPLTMIASKGSAENAEEKKQEKEEESPAGGGSMEVDLMTGGTGAFRFFDYASGEDLWIDPCDCIPDEFNSTSVNPSIDPSQMTQMPAGGNMMDMEQAPDVLISAKGDHCPLANKLSSGGMLSVSDDGECSKACRAKPECNYYFIGPSDGMTICLLFSRCDALMTPVIRNVESTPPATGKLFGVPRQHVCLVAHPEDCHNSAKRRKMVTGTKTDSKHTFSLSDWLTRSLAAAIPSQVTEIGSFGKELVKAITELHQSHANAVRTLAVVFAQETAQERAFEAKFGQRSSDWVDEDENEEFGIEDLLADDTEQMASGPIGSNRSASLVRHVESFLSQRDEFSSEEGEEDVEEAEDEEDDNENDADLDIFPEGSAARAAAIRAHWILTQTDKDQDKETDSVQTIHRMAQGDVKKVSQGPPSFLQIGASTGAETMVNASVLYSVTGKSAQHLRAYSTEELSFLSGQAEGDSAAFWLQVLQWDSEEGFGAMMGLGGEKSKFRVDGSSPSPGAMNLTLLEKSKLDQIAGHMHMLVRSSAMAKHLARDAAKEKMMRQKKHKHGEDDDDSEAYENLVPEPTFKEQVSEFVDVMKSTWEFLFMLPDSLLASSGLMGFVQTLLQIPGVFKRLWNTLKSAPRKLVAQVKKVKKLFIDIFKLFGLLARGGIKLVVGEFGSKVDATVTKAQMRLAGVYPRSALKVAEVPEQVKESISMAVSVFYQKIIASPAKQLVAEIMDLWLRFQNALLQAIRHTKDIFRPFFDGISISDFFGLGKRIMKAWQSMGEIPPALKAFTDGIKSLKEESYDIEPIFGTVSDALQFFIRLLMFPEDPEQNVRSMLGWSQQVRDVAEMIKDKHADIVTDGKVEGDNCLFERLLMDCEHKSLLDQLSEATLGTCGRCTLRARDPKKVYVGATPSVPRLEYASGSMLKATCRDERYVMYKKDGGFALKGLAMDVSCVDGNWVDSEGNPGLTGVECAAVVQVGTKNLSPLKSSAKEHLYFMNTVPVAAYGESSVRDFHAFVMGGGSVPGLSSAVSDGVFSALIGQAGVLPPPFNIAPLYVKVAKSTTAFGLVTSEAACVTRSVLGGFTRSELSLGSICDFDGDTGGGSGSLFSSKTFQSGFLGALENDVETGMADAYHNDPELALDVFDIDMRGSPTITNDLQGLGLSKGKPSSFFQLGASVRALSGKALLQKSLERANRTLTASEADHSAMHMDVYSHLLTAEERDRLDAAALLQLAALHHRAEFKEAMVEMRSVQASDGSFIMSDAARLELEVGMGGMSGSLIKRALISGGVPAGVVNMHTGANIKTAFSEQLGVNLGGDARFEGLFESMAETASQIRKVESELHASTNSSKGETAEGPPHKLSLAFACSMRHWSPQEWDLILAEAPESEKEIGPHGLMGKVSGADMHEMMEAFFEWVLETERDGSVGHNSECWKEDGGMVLFSPQTLLSLMKEEETEDLVKTEKENQEQPMSLLVVNRYTPDGTGMEQVTAMTLGTGAANMASMKIFKKIGNFFKNFFKKIKNVIKSAKTIFKVFTGKWGGLLKKGLGLFGKAMTIVKETFEKLKTLEFVQICQAIVEGVFGILEAYDNIFNYLVLIKNIVALMFNKHMRLIIRSLMLLIPGLATPSKLLFIIIEVIRLWFPSGVEPTNAEVEEELPVEGTFFAPFRTDGSGVNGLLYLPPKVECLYHDVKFVGKKLSEEEVLASTPEEDESEKWHCKPTTNLEGDVYVLLKKECDASGEMCFATLKQRDALKHWWLKHNWFKNGYSKNPGSYYGYCRTWDSLSDCEAARTGRNSAHTLSQAKTITCGKDMTKMHTITGIYTYSTLMDAIKKRVTNHCGKTCPAESKKGATEQDEYEKHKECKKTCEKSTRCHYVTITPAGEDEVTCTYFETIDAFQHMTGAVSARSACGAPPNRLAVLDKVPVSVTEIVGPFKYQGSMLSQLDEEGEGAEQVARLGYYQDSLEIDCSKAASGEFDNTPGGAWVLHSLGAPTISVMGENLLTDLVVRGEYTCALASNAVGCKEKVIKISGKKWDDDSASDEASSLSRAAKTYFEAVAEVEGLFVKWQAQCEIADFPTAYENWCIEQTEIPEDANMSLVYNHTCCGGGEGLAYYSPDKAAPIKGLKETTDGGVYSVQGPGQDCKNDADGKYLTPENFETFCAEQYAAYSEKKALMLGYRDTMLDQATEATKWRVIRAGTLELLGGKAVCPEGQVISSLKADADERKIEITLTCCAVSAGSISMQPLSHAYTPPSMRLPLDVNAWEGEYCPSKRDETGRMMFESCTLFNNPQAQGSEAYGRNQLVFNPARMQWCLKGADIPDEHVCLNSMAGHPAQAPVPSAASPGGGVLAVTVVEDMITAPEPPAEPTEILEKPSKPQKPPPPELVPLKPVDMEDLYSPHCKAHDKDKPHGPLVKDLPEDISSTEDLESTKFYEVASEPLPKESEDEADEYLFGDDPAEVGSDETAEVDPCAYVLTNERSESMDVEDESSTAGVPWKAIAGCKDRVDEREEAKGEATSGLEEIKESIQVPYDIASSIWSYIGSLTEFSFAPYGMGVELDVFDQIQQLAEFVWDKVQTHLDNKISDTETGFDELQEGDCDATDYALAKTLCDISCVSDAVRTGNRAIMDRLQDVYDTLLKNLLNYMDYHANYSEMLMQWLADLQDWHAQELTKKIDELGDKDGSSLLHKALTSCKAQMPPSPARIPVDSAEPPTASSSSNSVSFVHGGHHRAHMVRCVSRALGMDVGGCLNDVCLSQDAEMDALSERLSSFREAAESRLGALPCVGTNLHPDCRDAHTQRSVMALAKQATTHARQIAARARGRTDESVGRLETLASQAHAAPGKGKSPEVVEGVVRKVLDEVKTHRDQVGKDIDHHLQMLDAMGAPPQQQQPLSSWSRGVPLPGFKDKPEKSGKLRVSARVSDGDLQDFRSKARQSLDKLSGAFATLEREVSLWARQSPRSAAAASSWVASHVRRQAEVQRAKRAKVVRNDQSEPSNMMDMLREIRANQDSAETASESDHVSRDIQQVASSLKTLHEAVSVYLKVAQSHLGERSKVRKALDEYLMCSENEPYDTLSQRWEEMRKADAQTSQLLLRAWWTASEEAQKISSLLDSFKLPLRLASVELDAISSEPVAAVHLLVGVLPAFVQVEPSDSDLPSSLLSDSVCTDAETSQEGEKEKVGKWMSRAVRASLASGSMGQLLDFVDELVEVTDFLQGRMVEERLWHPATQKKMAKHARKSRSSTISLLQMSTEAQKEADTSLLGPAVANGEQAVSVSLHDTLPSRAEAEIAEDALLSLELIVKQWRDVVGGARKVRKATIRRRIALASTVQHRLQEKNAVGEDDSINSLLDSAASNLRSAFCADTQQSAFDLLQRSEKATLEKRRTTAVRLTDADPTAPRVVKRSVEEAVHKTSLPVIRAPSPSRKEPELLEASNRIEDEQEDGGEASDLTGETDTTPEPDTESTPEPGPESLLEMGTTPEPDIEATPEPDTEARPTRRGRESLLDIGTTPEPDTDPTPEPGPESFLEVESRRERQSRVSEPGQDSDVDDEAMELDTYQNAAAADGSEDAKGQRKKRLESQCFPLLHQTAPSLAPVFSSLSCATVPGSVLTSWAVVSCGSEMFGAGRLIVECTQMEKPFVAVSKDGESTDSTDDEDSQVPADLDLTKVEDLQCSEVAVSATSREASPVALSSLPPLKCFGSSVMRGLTLTTDAAPEPERESIAGGWVCVEFESYWMALDGNRLECESRGVLKDGKDNARCFSRDDEGAVCKEYLSEEDCKKDVANTAGTRRTQDCPKPPDDVPAWCREVPEAYCPAAAVMYTLRADCCSSSGTPDELPTSSYVTSCPLTSNSGVESFVDIDELECRGQGGTGETEGQWAMSGFEVVSCDSGVRGGDEETQRDRSQEKFAIRYTCTYLDLVNAVPFASADEGCNLPPRPRSVSVQRWGRYVADNFDPQISKGCKSFLSIGPCAPFAGEPASSLSDFGAFCPFPGYGLSAVQFESCGYHQFGSYGRVTTFCQALTPPEQVSDALVVARASGLPEDDPAVIEKAEDQVVGSVICAVFQTEPNGPSAVLESLSRQQMKCPTGWFLSGFQVFAVGSASDEDKAAAAAGTEDDGTTVQPAANQFSYSCCKSAATVAYSMTLRRENECDTSALPAGDSGQLELLYKQRIFCPSTLLISEFEIKPCYTGESEVPTGLRASYTCRRPMVLPGTVATSAKVPRGKCSSLGGKDMALVADASVPKDGQCADGNFVTGVSFEACDATKEDILVPSLEPSAGTEWRMVTSCGGLGAAQKAEDGGEKCEENSSEWTSGDDTKTLIEEVKKLDSACKAGTAMTALRLEKDADGKKLKVAFSCCPIPAERTLDVVVEGACEVLETGDASAVARLFETQCGGPELLLQSFKVEECPDAPPLPGEESLRTYRMEFQCAFLLDLAWTKEIPPSPSACTFQSISQKLDDKEWAASPPPCPVVTQKFAHCEQSTTAGGYGLMQVTGEDMSIGCPFSDKPNKMYILTGAEYKKCGALDDFITPFSACIHSRALTQLAQKQQVPPSSSLAEEGEGTESHSELVSQTGVDMDELPVRCETIDVTVTDIPAPSSLQFLPSACPKGLFMTGRTIKSANLTAYPFEAAEAGLENAEKLRCPEGLSMTINEATFENKETNKECKEDVTRLLVSRCEGLAECEITKNEIPKDPKCKTSLTGDKSLRLFTGTFNCLKNVQRREKVTACGDQTVNLECPAGLALRVIKATYRLAKKTDCNGPASFVQTHQTSPQTSSSEVQSGSTSTAETETEEDVGDNDVVDYESIAGECDRKTRCIFVLSADMLSSRLLKKFQSAADIEYICEQPADETQLTVSTRCCGSPDAYSAIERIERESACAPMDTMSIDSLRGVQTVCPAYVNDPEGRALPAGMTGLKLEECDPSGTYRFRALCEGIAMAPKGSLEVTKGDKCLAVGKTDKIADVMKGLFPSGSKGFECEDGRFLGFGLASPKGCSAGQYKNIAGCTSGSRESEDLKANQGKTAVTCEKEATRHGLAACPAHSLLKKLSFDSTSHPGGDGTEVPFLKYTCCKPNLGPRQYPTRRHASPCVKPEGLLKQLAATDGAGASFSCGAADYALQKVQILECPAGKDDKEKTYQLKFECAYVDFEEQTEYLLDDEVFLNPKDIPKTDEYLVKGPCGFPRKGISKRLPAAFSTQEAPVSFSLLQQQQESSSHAHSHVQDGAGAAEEGGPKTTLLHQSDTHTAAHVETEGEGVATGVVEGHSHDSRKSGVAKSNWEGYRKTEKTTPSCQPAGGEKTAIDELTQFPMSCSASEGYLNTVQLMSQVGSKCPVKKTKMSWECARNWKRGDCFEQEISGKTVPVPQPKSRRLFRFFKNKFRKTKEEPLQIGSLEKLDSRIQCPAGAALTSIRIEETTKVSLLEEEHEHEWRFFRRIVRAVKKVVQKIVHVFKPKPPPPVPRQPAPRYYKIIYQCCLNRGIFTGAEARFNLPTETVTTDWVNVKGKPLETMSSLRAECSDEMRVMTGLQFQVRNHRDLRMKATCQPIERGVDGGYSEWTPWSPCSLSCQSLRFRSCTNPRPSRGGMPCPDGEETVQVKPCDHDCVVGSPSAADLPPIGKVDPNIGPVCGSSTGFFLAGAAQESCGVSQGQEMVRSVHTCRLPLDLHDMPSREEVPPMQCKEHKSRSYRNLKTALGFVECPGTSIMENLRWTVKGGDTFVPLKNQKRETTCEDSGFLVLRCPRKKSVKILDAHLYGPADKTLPSVCPQVLAGDVEGLLAEAEAEHEGMGQCDSAYVKDAVAQQCNGRRRCKLKADASNLAAPRCGVDGLRTLNVRYGCVNSDTRSRVLYSCCDLIHGGGKGKGKKGKNGSKALKVHKAKKDKSSNLPGARTQIFESAIYHAKFQSTSCFPNRDIDDLAVENADGEAASAEAQQSPYGELECPEGFFLQGYKVQRCNKRERRMAYKCALIDRRGWVSYNTAPVHDACVDPLALSSQFAFSCNQNSFLSDVTFHGCLDSTKKALALIASSARTSRHESDEWKETLRVAGEMAGASSSTGTMKGSCAGIELDPAVNGKIQSHCKSFTGDWYDLPSFAIDGPMPLTTLVRIPSAHCLHDFEDGEGKKSGVMTELKIEKSSDSRKARYKYKCCLSSREFLMGRDAEKEQPPIIYATTQCAPIGTQYVSEVPEKLSFGCNGDKSGYALTSFQFEPCVPESWWQPAGWYKVKYTCGAADWTKLDSEALLSAEDTGLPVDDSLDECELAAMECEVKGSDAVWNGKNACEQMDDCTRLCRKVEELSCKWLEWSLGVQRKPRVGRGKGSLASSSSSSRAVAGKRHGGRHRHHHRHRHQAKHPSSHLQAAHMRTYHHQHRRHANREATSAISKRPPHHSHSHSPSKPLKGASSPIAASVGGKVGAQSLTVTRRSHRRSTHRRIRSHRRRRHSSSRPVPSDGPEVVGLSHHSHSKRRGRGRRVSDDPEEEEEEEEEGDEEEEEEEEEEEDPKAAMVGSITGAFSSNPGDWAEDMETLWNSTKDLGKYTGEAMKDYWNETQEYWANLTDRWEEDPLGAALELVGTVHGAIEGTIIGEMAEDVGKRVKGKHDDYKSGRESGASYRMQKMREEGFEGTDEELEEAVRREMAREKVTAEREKAEKEEAKSKGMSVDELRKQKAKELGMTDAAYAQKLAEEDDIKHMKNEIAVEAKRAAERQKEAEKEAAIDERAAELKEKNGMTDEEARAEAEAEAQRRAEAGDAAAKAKGEEISEMSPEDKKKAAAEAGYPDTDEGRKAWEEDEKRKAGDQAERDRQLKEDVAAARAKRDGVTKEQALKEMAAEEKTAAETIAKENEKRKKNGQDLMTPEEEDAARIYAEAETQKKKNADATAERIKQEKAADKYNADKQGVSVEVYREQEAKKLGCDTGAQPECLDRKRAEAAAAKQADREKAYQDEKSSAEQKKKDWDAKEKQADDDEKKLREVEAQGGDTQDAAEKQLVDNNPEVKKEEDNMSPEEKAEADKAKKADEEALEKEAKMKKDEAQESFAFESSMEKKDDDDDKDKKKEGEDDKDKDKKEGDDKDKKDDTDTKKDDDKKDDDKKDNDKKDNDKNDNDKKDKDKKDNDKKPSSGGGKNDDKSSRKRGDSTPGYQKDTVSSAAKKRDKVSSPGGTSSKDRKKDSKKANKKKNKSKSGSSSSSSKKKKCKLFFETGSKRRRLDGDHPSFLQFPQFC
uniref:Uncharacterized protein n=1 Tax=Chromera velia CCMP2878 TaxID=1169474 RepID=A0A0G4I0X2_9ALVE|eukprot:Cvel_10014.t1-p1 / transcript=Cvel_10014.t1 / gene=Cvel_10014 / organism=Chromera_velia_CCMP2878 / gene_product=SCO-spondin, putative / transcript_product=SCO-spondin, putative / location=Cvel_scaffold594:1151-37483(+) / protein_length=7966 / sequence_SO=supercontig / SO=protein_coding / is_pseudo=false